MESLPTSQQAIANKRREKDIMKLMVSEYDVTLADTISAQNKLSSEFFVKLKGPAESPYEGVRLTLAYPFLIGYLAGSGNAPRSLPLQISFDWIC